jgi:hypothetical protein
MEAMADAEDEEKSGLDNNGAVPYHYHSGSRDISFWGTQSDEIS